MNNIKGLKEYLNNPIFRESLNIPKNSNIDCAKLAQGEYNINYLLIHPITKKKLVLRINSSSQMHLDNQIKYEYDALKFLEISNHTPKAIFLDDSKKHLDFGLLIMEFLEGKSLNYKKDLEIAAISLADIHSLDASNNKKLLSPKNPLKAILEECNTMFGIYLNSPIGDKYIKNQIIRLLKCGEEKLTYQGEYKGYRCCINTELNSSNFLVNGLNKSNYIIDWEKPLLGNPIQDLGHFLAPTTTFWKTDIILNNSEIDYFVDKYIKAVNNRFSIENLKDSLDLYIAITCLRGITWCAMAWVQYKDNSKLIKNNDTFIKLESYLNKEFLDNIEKTFFN